MRISRVLQITICASLLVLLLNLSSGAQSSGDVEMSIADGGVVKTGVPNLRVTFRNLRDEEINLYLGTVGGRGPRPCKLDNREITCTFNFNLSVTDASGTTRKFKFRGMSYVAGRLDPYIIHLQAHSTYAIELGIDHFWSPDTGGYESLRLDAGKHDIFLEFEGRAPGSVNLDQPYIKQMNFWKGKLTSNTLKIDITSKVIEWSKSRSAATMRQRPQIFSCPDRSMVSKSKILRSRANQSL